MLLIFKILYVHMGLGYGKTQCIIRVSLWLWDLLPQENAPSLLKHLFSGLRGFSGTADALLFFQNIYFDGLFYSRQLFNKLLLAKRSPREPRDTQTFLFNLH